MKQIPGIRGGGVIVHAIKPRKTWPVMRAGPAHHNVETGTRTLPVGNINLKTSNCAQHMTHNQLSSPSTRGAFVSEFSGNRIARFIKVKRSNDVDFIFVVVWLRRRKTSR
jgi:hypothetical protein